MTKKYNKQWFSKNEPSESSTQNKQKNFGIRFFLLLIVIFTASIGIGTLATQKHPLLSPLDELSTFKFLRTSLLLPSGKEKLVYGFLPYWSLKTANLHDSLNRVGYFSLAISADGSLSKQEDGVDPGYSKLKSDDFLKISEELTKKKVPIDIVLTQFDATTIDQFLASQEAREKMIAQLDNVLLAYPFSGVNIDIEYAATVSAQSRNNLSDFMSQLRNHLNQKYEDIELSIDVFASAGKDTQIWDLEKISENVDYIVVMAYDFHHRSSHRAGPVAPLFSGPKSNSDISTFMKMFLEKVPNEKIVLGIPFYGYEWQTTSREANSFTMPNTGRAATYKRIEDLIKKRSELNLKRHWSEQSLSPYLSYTDGENTYVLHYEDPRSLSYKLDFVNQLDLRGIAIWALGYEGNDQKLWQVIEEKM